MFTRELEENIKSTRADAKRRGLEIITIEHLILVLITENTEVQKLLANCQADTQGLTENLANFLATQVPVAKIMDSAPTPTAVFHRVLENAVSQNRKKNAPNQKINGVHVLAAVFTEPESHAAYYLQKHGMERLTIFTHLAKPATIEKETTAEEKIGVNLTTLIAAGQLEKPFARDKETSALSRILIRKYKNNPLLIGEPGVGKTTVVHALAYQIADKAVPTALADVRLLQVSTIDLVAGTKYRGDFEQRMREITADCHKHGKTIVFIDEIHTLIGAGAVAGGAMDAANMLKPLLSDPNIRVIGATTFADYRRIFEKDTALARRFQKVEIHEPNNDALQTILNGVIKRLSVHHCVAYAPTAATAAIELTRRYLPNRHLPDKAIDLLDDAGATRQQSAKMEALIDRTELTEVVLRMAGLPPTNSPYDTPVSLTHLNKQLTDTVLDQPEAAERLSRAVLRARFGFHDSTKTVGAYLFVGPTGVGKTEMVKQLAKLLNISLLRYDMSEYMERHAVARLIGAPPGYVGFEQSGKLVEDIFCHPNAVVLFDEVEKAHPDVLNILLQILDYGILTDNNGRTANFANALIVLTSNLGSAEITRGTSGFEQTDTTALIDEPVHRFFSPEFRNRLDAVIRFQPLSQPTIERILDKQLDEMLRFLFVQKGIRVNISAKLRTLLLTEGFSPNMGARPLERLLREKILEPLALAEANNQLSNGKRHRLDLNEHGVFLRTITKKQPIPA